MLGCQMWGSNPLLLREELELHFLPIVGCCAESGVYGEIVSQPLLPTPMWVWVFSCLPDV